MTKSCAASPPAISPTIRKLRLPRRSANSRSAPQKLRASSSDRCFTVSRRKPSQSLTAIQYLKQSTSADSVSAPSSARSFSAKKSVRLCSACGSSRPPALERALARRACNVRAARSSSGKTPSWMPAAVAEPCWCSSRKRRAPALAGSVRRAVELRERQVRRLVAQRVEAGRGRHVAPVVAGVVGDDVEDDAQAAGVRVLAQVDEILARAEPRIDLEEVLDAVAVEGVEPGPLLEDRADPQRGHAEALQVVEPAADARDGAALPARARGRPLAPVDVGPRRRRPQNGAPRLRQQLAGVFAAVAEAVGQQEVEHLVAPVGRRRRVAAERRGALEQRVDVVERRRAGGGDDVAWRHAGLSRGLLKETTA